MKFRSTLWMALVLVVLCLAYGGMKYRQARVKEHVAAAKRLFHFEGGAVRSLEIERVNEAACAAQRGADGKWVMSKPDAAITALGLLWDRVSNNLAELSNEREIAVSPTDLKAYGLEEPALRVSAQVDQESPVELICGDLDPTETYRYARLNQGPVFLMTKKSFFELDRKLEDLRDRFLVNDRNAALLRMEFARIWTGRGSLKMENPPDVGTESVAVVLSRASKDAPWQVEEPVKAYADQEHANDLAKEIQFAMGSDFVDHPENLTDYGLQPANVRITVRDEKDGKDQTIYVGSSAQDKKGMVYLRRADWNSVCMVDGHLVALFPETPDAFRDRRLLTHAASDIRSLEYQSGSDSFLLEKDEKNAWKVTRPELPSLDELAISDYLARLKRAVADSFPEGAPESLGLNTPELTLTLHFANGESGVIRLKADPGDAKYFFATQDIGVPVRMQEAYAEELFTTANAFRRRDLMNFQKKEAQRLEFSFEGQGYVLEKAHEQWVVKSPEHKILASQNDVDLLLDVLCNVQAVAREPKPSEDLNTYGLAQPLFRVFVSLPNAGDPAKPPTLLGPLSVGQAAPDNPRQRFANTGDGGVYRVKQDLVDAVREMLKGIKDAG